MTDSGQRLLSALRRWGASREEELRADGMVVELHSSGPERDKPAGWLIVEGDAAVGQLTVWNTGEAAVECAAVQPGSVVRCEHHDLASTAELHAVIDRLLQWVRRPDTGK